MLTLDTNKVLQMQNTFQLLSNILHNPLGVPICCNLLKITIFNNSDIIKTFLIVSVCSI